MEENKYIVFSREDIISALEDFYEKETGEKIDIRFDLNNLQGFKQIKSITFKKSLSSHPTIEPEPQIGINEEYKTPSISEAKGYTTLDNISISDKYEIGN